MHRKQLVVVMATAVLFGSAITGAAALGEQVGANHHVVTPHGPIGNTHPFPYGRRRFIKNHSGGSGGNTQPPSYAFTCGGAQASVTFSTVPAPCGLMVATLDCPEPLGALAGVHIAGFQPTLFSSFVLGSLGQCILNISEMAIVFNGTQGNSPVQLAVCCPSGITVPYSQTCGGGRRIIDTSTNPELVGLTVTSIDIVHPTQINGPNFGEQPQPIYLINQLNGIDVGTPFDMTVKTTCPTLPELPCVPTGN